MTDEQFAALLTLPHEQGHVEHKGPAAFKEQPLTAKVVRAALGMSNRRDGGMIIIGVEDNQGQLNPVGLSAQQLTTWIHDHIADEFRRYALPSIRFDTETRHHNGNPFVVLTVHEFDDVPVLCQKQFIHPDSKQLILRKGALYVRPRGKPETVEVSTVEDMRDLLDLATDKLLRRHVARNFAAGWTAPVATERRDVDAFSGELAHPWAADAAEVLDKIATRGSWRVVIRPQEYQAQRISPLPTLFALVEKHAVNIRGWDYPHVDNRREAHFDANWVGYAYEWGQFVEAWRLFQSGQFEDIAGYDEDWINQRKSFVPYSAPPGWEPGAQLAVESVVFRCTEIFELAVRLAGDERYEAGGRMHVKIAMQQVKGRTLYIADTRKFGFSRPYQANIDEIVYTTDISTEELIARPWDLALDAALYFFHRFHWEPERASLRATQEQLKRL